MLDAEKVLDRDSMEEITEYQEGREEKVEHREDRQQDAP